MKNIKKVGTIILLIAFYVAAMTLFVKTYQADEDYTYGQTLLAKGKYSQALTYANDAVVTNPYEPIYYRGRVKTLLALLAVVEATDKAAIKKMIVTDLETAYELNPKNLATIRNSVPLYFYLATSDLTQPSGPDNVDVVYLPVAQAFYQKITDISPNDVGIYVLLAKYEKKLGLRADYDANIERIKKLRPDLLDWHEDLK